MEGMSLDTFAVKRLWDSSDKHLRTCSNDLWTLSSFNNGYFLGGRLQMVRKLEPSWHHLSGSGYLVPWTLGVLNGIAAWLKWTEPLSPSGGDAYFVSAKGCDQQGDWGGKIYTKQVSEDPTIHDQVFKSHFSRLRGELDTIIRRCNPPIRSSLNNMGSQWFTWMIRHKVCVTNLCTAATWPDACCVH